MVELSNVTKNYGRAQVLQNICLTLDEPRHLLPFGAERRQEKLRC